MKKASLFSVGILFVLAFSVFSCRQMKDDQPLSNRVLGIWELQTSSKPTYNFKSDGIVSIKDGDSVQERTYSVSHENYDDPTSDKDKVDVVRLGGTKYLLHFSDASHMTFRTKDSSNAPLVFVRRN